MSAERVLFTIFSLASVGGALMVVFSQNVVRMAFWLVVSLGSASGLFFLLNADFVAATQLLIYVGGTLVLLIFGVMLTASGPLMKLKMSAGDTLLAVVIGGCLFAVVSSSVSSVNWDRAAIVPLELSEEKFHEVHELLEVKAMEVEEQFLAAEGSEAEKLGHRLEVLEEAHHLLHEFMPTSGDAWKLAEGTEVSEEVAATFLELCHESGLAFSPQDDPDNPHDGTARPLGLGLLGMRPAQDLHAPKDKRRVSEGFYVAKPKSSEFSQRAKPSDLSTGYLLPFEIVSVHLLVVLIGAAYLARAKRRADQVPSQPEA